MTKRFALATVTLFAIALGQAAAATRHVVLIVWDGMRRDFVTEQYAPTLEKLAREGVRFRNHHSVYPTMTDVNGAALATGCYPDRNGLCANLEFRPAINSRQPIEISDPDAIKRGDESSGGKYLGVPTFPELLRKAGKSVALVGTKSVALLFDRHNQWAVVKMQNRPLTAFAGAPIKKSQREDLVKLLGPFVDDAKASTAQRNDFATRTLTEFLWRDGVPDFSLLWLSEPDFSEHNFAPGSPEALAAIKAVDGDLASVLGALEKKHARDSTDVLVVSDHGFSTIHRSLDLVALLNAAGFHAAQQFSDAPQAGDILVAGNAGTVLFYVHDHERKTTQRLVDWLQQSDLAGVIFTREQFEGTFSLDSVRMAAPAAADVVMAFRSYPDKNQFGIPGMIDADWNRPAGQGTHATLGATDVHNTLIAAGPDFHAREENVASGNIDIAPTVLALLGMRANAQMDGRELSSHGRAEATPKRLEASRALDHGTWKQWINTTTLNHTIYFDDGGCLTDHQSPITNHRH